MPELCPGRRYGPHLCTSAPELAKAELDVCFRSSPSCMLLPSAHKAEAALVQQVMSRTLRRAQTQAKASSVQKDLVSLCVKFVLVV